MDINIKPVDQFTSTAEEFTNDIAFRILFDCFTDVLDNNEYRMSETNSDIQSTVGARCMVTGEDENELLNMIDQKTQVFGYSR